MTSPRRKPVQHATGVSSSSDRVERRNASTNNTIRPTTTAQKAPEYVTDEPAGNCEYDPQHPNFENMIIECDDDDSDNVSTAELTFDGSIMHDEGYWRNQQLHYRRPGDNHHHNTSIERYEYTLQQRQRQRQQPRIISPQRSVPRRSSFSSSRSRDRPPPSQTTSPPNRGTQRQLSLEEEEQLLIEIAMERSLQDSQSGASMSMSESHMSAASGMGSQRSRASSCTGMSTSSNLGNAGCHLTMIANNLHHELPERARSNCGNFVWKREGKKWMKVPIHNTPSNNNCINHHQHHHRSMSRVASSGLTDLQAIKEAENENLNDSWHQSQHKTSKPDAWEFEDDEEVDYHIQRRVDEALNRSLRLDEALNRSLSAQLNRSSGNWSFGGDSFGGEYETTASTSTNNREAVLAQRLHELEQEKAVIERALQQGPRLEPPRCHHPMGRHDMDRRGSFQSRPRTVSTNSGDLNSYRSDQQLSQQSPLSNGSSKGGGNSSIAGSATPSGRKQKLAWKRGPNGAFVRVPGCEGDQGEDSEGRAIQSREEALLVEALHRSLREM